MKKRKFAAAGAAGAFSLLLAFPAFAEQRPTGYQATFGIVSSVEKDSFTLREKRPEGDAEVTVSITEETTFKKSGVADEAADLIPGQQVVVRGLADESGLAAASVNIMAR